MLEQQPLNCLPQCPPKGTGSDRRMRVTPARESGQLRKVWPLANQGPQDRSGLLQGQVPSVSEEKEGGNA